MYGDGSPSSNSLIAGNEIVEARTRGVGVLDLKTCLAYGVSGPIARASGLDIDLRRDDPYLAYATLFAPGGPGRVVTRTAGDCLARLEVLLEQVHVSLDLAQACIDTLRTLPAGPVNQRLPKVLKVPEGERYTVTENPLGFNGYYLVSRGEKTPWRLKLRFGLFLNNVQVLSRVLPRLPRGRHGGRSRLDVLRRRRRRQVGAGPPAAASCPRRIVPAVAPCRPAESGALRGLRPCGVRSTPRAPALRSQEHSAGSGLAESGALRGLRTFSPGQGRMRP